MADPNQNRVIDDVLFQAFQNASAKEQRDFIYGLNEEELSELEFLVTGKYIGPETYASRATYPTGPDGMPLYDYPREGSGRQDVAMELFSGLREKSFDYSGLPNSKLRRGLSFMDTAGEKEARAWTIPAGASAPEAAGVIHSDFEHGFIRAEVIAYDDYISLNGESGAKEAGKWRLEGKDYLLADGDVVHFRFNV